MTSQFDLTSIIADINGLLPQLSNFISQINTLVNQNNIQIIVDAAGNMSLDAPGSMTDLELNSLSKRINVIDALIASHKSNITTLFQQASNIENASKIADSSQVSELASLSTRFDALKVSYKH